MTPHPAAPTLPTQNRASETGAPQRPPGPAVALIAAIASNRVIGTENRLPWRLADDLKRFRALTLGHAVIMGRKTWESLARALPGRQNIVVTRQRAYAAAGAEVAASFDGALALVRLPAPAFCIGGGELYRAALPRASRLYLTEIERDFTGDATFPPLRNSEWRQVDREAGRSAEPDAFEFTYVTYERTASAD
ncbi:MAG: dihydrofolate reductase [Betaproteobacteria bacterium]